MPNPIFVFIISCSHVLCNFLDAHTKIATKSYSLSIHTNFLDRRRQHLFESADLFIIIISHLYFSGSLRLDYPVSIGRRQSISPCPSILHVILFLIIVFFFFYIVIYLVLPLSASLLYPRHLWKSECVLILPL